MTLNVKQHTIEFLLRAHTVTLLYVLSLTVEVG
jgi:hypothetical protein